MEGLQYQSRPGTWCRVRGSGSDGPGAFEDKGVRYRGDLFWSQRKLVVSSGRMLNVGGKEKTSFERWPWTCQTV